MFNIRKNVKFIEIESVNIGVDETILGCDESGVMIDNTGNSLNEKLMRTLCVKVNNLKF